MFSDADTVASEDWQVGCRSPYDSAVDLSDSQSHDDDSIFTSTPSHLSSSDELDTKDSLLSVRRHCYCLNHSTSVSSSLANRDGGLFRSCSNLRGVEDDDDSFELPYPDVVDSTEIEVGQVCGYGGSGHVRKGYFRGRAVALKTPRENVQYSRIWLEARMCSVIRHQRIVDFYGVSVLEAGPSLVMEYCAGGSLMGLLSKIELHPQTTVQWAMQIAEGMMYLHTAVRNAPILHCDLKSANILLVDEVDLDRPDTVFSNSVKICDFGSARFASDQRTPVSCTFSWLSPEAIRYSQFSLSSDVWSFGTVLWEMVTGETPYQNLSQHEVAFGIAMRELQLDPPKSCPVALSKIMEDCWSYYPAQRPDFAKILKHLTAIGPADFALATFERTVGDLHRRELALRSREEDIREEEEQHAKARVSIEKSAARLNRLEMALNAREEELSSLEQTNQGRWHSKMSRSLSTSLLYKTPCTLTNFLKRFNCSTPETLSPKPFLSLLA